MNINMKKSGMIMILLFAIVSINLVSAAISSFPSVCCEKTKSGAFCINTAQTDCAPGFKSAPSSCSQTNYCRLGTCYDSKEGICMENTPQLVCNSQNGTWIEKPLEQTPQCQLGCCIISDQAAFVSLVRCKRLSSFYGIAINFRTDIASELDCIATAQGQDMGACVYEQDFERTCKFETRAECGAADGIVNASSNRTVSEGKKFYKDYLCSAEALATTCARQASTNCYQGKVYWFDSCGNRENVYSSNKQKSWNNGKVAEPDTIVPLNNGNDKNNGNCDYLQGARCAKNNGLTGEDYYCKRTDCSGTAEELGGKTKRMNGESWCVYDTNVGSGLDTAGSRHYREICVDGEVQTEACDDLRARVCFENDDINTSTGSFSTAACRVNRWQFCLEQTDKEECLDRDQRECIWLPSIAGLNAAASSSSTTGNTNTGFSNPTANTGFTGAAVAPLSDEVLLSDDEEAPATTSNRASGICVPNYPPGFKFWNSQEAAAQCEQASAKCIVKYEKKIIGSKKCVENCECEEEAWAAKANNICKSIGDCGGYFNYLGKYTDQGYSWTVDGGKEKFTANTQNLFSSKLTGRVISIDIVQKLGEQNE